MPDGLIVAVTVAGGGRGAAVATRGLGTWLAGIAPRRARGEVSLAVVTDARMRKLNRQYRSKDRPTDVLSFPSATADGPGSVGANRPLGDIAIAAGVAARQAREVGHSLSAELRVLALHGLLHLLGYDHDRDEGRMGRVEARLRRRGGLGSGLVERAAAVTERSPARRRAGARDR